MKKYHFIFGSSAVFVFLFVNQEIGLNLALFGLALVSMITYFFRERIINYREQILIVTSVFSCLAFAWYGDFASFLALVVSILFLQFRMQSPHLKTILVFPITAINAFSTSIRFFYFAQWLPEAKINSNSVKKILAYAIIPLSFTALFFTVYSFGSAHFASVFTDYTFAFNPYQFIFVVVFGTYFSFSFWNYWVPEFCLELNSKCSDELNQELRLKYPKVDADFKRRSGEITFLLLNLLLVVFLITFNYEHYSEFVSTSQLSAALHDRVNAVFVSILLSVLVVLLYFRGQFNFDPKAKKMKLLVKIWIVLNGILIVSALVSNSDYISVFGLTYKRLGVYAFLFLAAISLFFTFRKIEKQKSNAYLLNQMMGYTYGLILLCSFVNWGNLITMYNISEKKGIEPFFLTDLNFNDAARRQFFLENKIDGGEVEKRREKEIQLRQQDSFLSTALYYEFLK